MLQLFRKTEPEPERPQEMDTHPVRAIFRQTLAEALSFVQQDQKRGTMEQTLVRSAVPIIKNYLERMTDDELLDIARGLVTYADRLRILVSPALVVDSGANESRVARGPDGVGENNARALAVGESALSGSD